MYQWTPANNADAGYRSSLRLTAPWLRTFSLPAPKARDRKDMAASSLSTRLNAHLTGMRRRGRILRLTPFDTATEEGRSHERFRRASLSSAASAAAKGIALVTTLVSVPLTLGYLGGERFGVWMTLSAIVALLGFTDLGIGNSLLNGVAHAAGRDDRILFRTNVSNGVAMLVAVAAGSGLVFAAVYDHVPWAKLFNVESVSARDEVGAAAAVLVVCFLIGCPRCSPAGPLWASAGIRELCLHRHRKHRGARVA